MSKTIGILAMTAPGASIFYANLYAQAAQISPAYYPEVTLYNPPLNQYLDTMPSLQQDWPALLIKAAQRLIDAGAQVLVAPSNTPHIVHQQVQAHLDVPWLHIVESVKIEANRQNSQKILLLGTKDTVESELYDEYFGSELVKPTTEEIQVMDEMIIQHLIYEVVTDDIQTYFNHILEKYQALGVDSVILGCTELPLVISKETTSLTILDSIQTLVQMTLKYSM